MTDFDPKKQFTEGACLLSDQSGGKERLNLPAPEAEAAFGVGGAPNYLADSFTASPNYSSRSNYSPAGPPRVLVIHDMEGSYESCVGWFQQTQAEVSAHYAVASNGRNTQFVGEQYAAWHVSYDNGFTIGIEHEGYASTGRYFTETMLESSAKLAAGICHRWGIPVAHSTSHGICGHVDLGAAGGGHHDPGAYWPWDKYLALVKQYLSGASPTPTPTPSGKTMYRVMVSAGQAGAFSSQANANDMAAKLKALNVKATVTAGKV